MVQSRTVASVAVLPMPCSPRNATSLGVLFLHFRQQVSGIAVHGPQANYVLRAIQSAATLCEEGIGYSSVQ
jgi:hypothetical protein